MDFGERIQYILETENWTQAQFARKAGVTRGNINQWLKLAECDIKWKTVDQIEQNTGYRMDWVAKGIEPKKVTEPLLYSGESELLRVWRTITDKKRALAMLAAQAEFERQEATVES